MKLKTLPRVKGTMYINAGCPWPSIRLSATYVTKSPTKVKVGIYEQSNKTHVSQ